MSILVAEDIALTVNTAWRLPNPFALVFQMETRTEVMLESRLERIDPILEIALYDIIVVPMIQTRSVPVVTQENVAEESFGQRDPCFNVDVRVTVPVAINKISCS